ncbi:RNA polymerase sigma factor [Streptomyces sp. NBC_01275]|uniref:RNA polymerase sigma factor n=1 Tax=Streptomyces sp. NBC_01275 TaxID=2903807 RepID=UPI002253EF48|nr:RNA polymerase sigma factor [Streptomyces sp. NBC_01275]MCX4764929.1 RNA polymerase sigma factor [Streptomyces sp. NBC_01275]
MSDDPPDDDNHLVRAIAEGSEEALSTLIARRSGLVLAYLLHRRFPVDVIEEAVQETFLSVWKSASQFHEGSARAWLLRIAGCRAVDLSRAHERSWARADRAARERFVPEEAVAPSADERLFASFPDSPALARAFARLPARQREVLGLRYFEQLTVEETAGRLGLRPGTVTAHATRGLARLRELLRDEGEGREGEQRRAEGDEGGGESDD